MADEWDKYRSQPADEWDKYKSAPSDTLAAQRSKNQAILDRNEPFENAMAGTENTMPGPIGTVSALAHIIANKLKNPGQAVSDFGSGVADVAKGLVGQFGERPDANGFIKSVNAVPDSIPGASPMKAGVNAVYNAVRSQTDPAAEALRLHKAKRDSEALGNAVASVVPVVGPLAKGFADRFAGEPEYPPSQTVTPMRPPDPMGAAGTIAALAVPSAIKKVASGPIGAKLKGTAESVTSPRTPQNAMNRVGVYMQARQLPRDVENYFASSDPNMVEEAMAHVNKNAGGVVDHASELAGIEKSIDQIENGVKRPLRENAMRQRKTVPAKPIADAIAAEQPEAAFVRDAQGNLLNPQEYAKAQSAVAEARARYSGDLDAFSIQKQKAYLNSLRDRWFRMTPEQRAQAELSGHGIASINAETSALSRAEEQLLDPTGSGGLRHVNKLESYLYDMKGAAHSDIGQSLKETTGTPLDKAASHLPRLKLGMSMSGPRAYETLSLGSDKTINAGLAKAYRGIREPNALPSIAPAPVQKMLGYPSWDDPTVFRQGTTASPATGPRAMPSIQDPSGITVTTEPWASVRELHPPAQPVITPEVLERTTGVRYGRPRSASDSASVFQQVGPTYTELADQMIPAWQAGREAIGAEARGALKPAPGKTAADAAAVFQSTGKGGVPNRVAPRTYAELFDSADRRYAQRPRVPSTGPSDVQQRVAALAESLGVSDPAMLNESDKAAFDAIARAYINRGEYETKGFGPAVRYHSGASQ